MYGKVSSREVRPRGEKKGLNSELVKSKKKLDELDLQLLREKGSSNKV